jgi:N-formylglutamate amidohydrolase
MRVFCKALILLAFVATADGAEAKPEPLVTVEKGDLPIILSAPHGGRTPIPGIEVRKGPPGVAQFVVARDDNTAELTEKLAAAIEKELGARPYVVIARFERKYADPNRPAKDAYESAAAAPHYEAYHAALRSACDDVRKKWGRGLLLDVHGQAAKADGIFRGTAGGKSVTALLEKSGKPALLGPDSIVGHLARHGYAVIPDPTAAGESIGEEDKRYNGGYIVRTYGSAENPAIDAIQLELGTQLRAKANLAKTATDIAAAVKAFHKAYLPTKKAEK